VPFPHTPAAAELQREGRIFSTDWDRYTGDTVVFRPRHMSPERLEELYDLAWKSFYRDEPQQMKMSKLLKKVVAKEMADNTFVPRRRDLAHQRFGSSGPGTVPSK
jgi:hypothetical protein